MIRHSGHHGSPHVMGSAYKVAIPWREGMQFQFRAESYNTFNHTRFHDVNTTLTDANFGEVTSTYDPPILQFGAKFVF